MLHCQFREARSHGSLFHGQFVDLHGHLRLSGATGALRFSLRTSSMAGSGSCGWASVTATRSILPEPGPSETTAASRSARSAPAVVSPHSVTAQPLVATTITVPAIHRAPSEPTRGPLKGRTSLLPHLLLTLPVEGAWKASQVLCCHFASLPGQPRLSGETGVLRLSWLRAAAAAAPDLCPGGVQ